jgi:hypothetical protein
VRKEVLIAPARGVNSILAMQLLTAYKYRTDHEKNSNERNGKNGKIGGVKKTKSSLLRDGFSFSHIRDLYPIFEYKDIASHPAIVILPYQVRSSTFSAVQYSTAQYNVASHTAD